MRQHNKIDFDEFMKIIHNIENEYCIIKYKKTKQEIFDEFLKDNNIYEKYYYYINKCHIYNIGIQKYIKMKQLIESPFYWNETQECFGLWKKK